MGDKSSAPARTPAKTPSAVKKSSSFNSSSNTLPSSTGKQQSILGFFAKASTPAKPNGSTPTTKPTTTPRAPSSTCLKETTTKSNSLSFAKHPSTITPVPSSDAVEPLSSQENMDSVPLDSKVPIDSLPSPGASSEVDEQSPVVAKAPATSSPSRKVRHSPKPSFSGHEAYMRILRIGQEDSQVR